MANITPVILVGGEGARLAPLSTPECPKPFIPFTDGTSLLQHTLARVAGDKFAQPLLIGNETHRFLMLNHARAAQANPLAMLLEQARYNTGCAIAVCAAFLCARQQADSVCAFLPADHAIADALAWQEALAEAAHIARDEEVLVLLGMTPDRDSTDYGYIDHDGQGRVRGFREKPADAGALRAQGWVWNSGQVIARARVVADACATHAPTLWQAALQAVANTEQRREFHSLPVMTLRAEHAQPFDRAVLEHANNLRVVAAECGWQDVGTREAFMEYAGITHPRERQDRPWGYTENIGNSEHTLSKQLTLYPGCRISLQRHRARDEHWSIIEGAATVTLNDECLQLAAGDAVLVPRGVWHRLENAGDGLLRVHEVQAGNPDESDIERIEDDYGRV